MSKLLIVAAAALVPVSASAQAPAQLTINLANFAFSPVPIHLAAGKPVTLTFVNRAGGGHDFTAPAFFQRARFLAGTASGGEIDLRGHETKSVTLIPAAGTYRVHCSHFLHKQMGMSDVIVVN